MQNTYLTTQQVAEALHTNASTIRASRVSGVLYGLPAPLHIKLGKNKILYEQDEIDIYMQKHTRRRVVE